MAVLHRMEASSSMNTQQFDEDHKSVSPVKKTEHQMKPDISAPSDETSFKSKSFTSF